MSLAERLRDATRELHAQAERSGVMRTLLRGELGRGDYALLLRNLHAIYAALEAALAQHGGHPVLAPVDDPALRRRAALEADLALLAGADWAERPAAGAGQRRLRATPAGLRGADAATAARACLRPLPGRPQRRPAPAGHRGALAAAGRRSRHRVLSLRGARAAGLATRFRAGLNAGAPRTPGTPTRSWARRDGPSRRTCACSRNCSS